MSERKVIQKYYPPDFDPSALTRKKGPKQAGPKFVPVRLMAPFSMQCTRCGEYIAKGRKFNARKEVTGETYLAIKIIRFYIRCTRCSGEVTFCTDPRNNDYTCERGAKRNYEPWRDQDAIEETDEQRLDRLEAEEADEDIIKDVDAMAELESKREEAQREMAIADALDEIRTRNARLEKAERDDQEQEAVIARVNAERQKQDEEDNELAKKAFSMEDGEQTRGLAQSRDQKQEDVGTIQTASAVSFAPRARKRKNNFAIPGLIKKKVIA